LPRYLAIDYGLRRIGIAISDFDGRIASPECMPNGSGAPVADAEAVLKTAAELDAAEFVVGLPLNMDGTDSEQTKRTRSFVEALQARTSLPVHLWDERLSSHAADLLLRDRELTRKKRKARQDALAAAVILTGFLEHRQKS